MWHLSKNQGFRNLLQNPKVSRKVMGFSNRAQRFTPRNYLRQPHGCKDIYISLRKSLFVIQDFVALFPNAV